MLLSAGAGFGKTTLLAAWASQYPHPVAWLSLDRLDNDPLGFWSVVLAALRARYPAIGEAVLAQAPQPLQITTLLTTLINDLAGASEEIVLILDDYHVIDEPGIHTSLQFLLNHAPTRLHLVLSSRVDPPLSLSRLRARGQMAELRDMDLRVSEQEGASFLQQVMDVHLSAEDEQRLAQRTEGWLAGLQLAALSLSTRADPGSWVATFSGSQRLILDYFQDENSRAAEALRPALPAARVHSATDAPLAVPGCDRERGQPGGAGSVGAHQPVCDAPGRAAAVVSLARSLPRGAAGPFAGNSARPGGHAL